MDTVYVVTVVLAALAYAYAALLSFVGAHSVKLVADRVRVPRRLMMPLGLLLASGAAGLLVGLVDPPLGIAAAAGLVVYFIAALIAHLRVHDRGIGGALGFLVLALAVLTVQLARHG